jgi:hypothetical protein
MTKASLVLMLGACTLATNFDRSKSIEQTAALCSDGIDNDSDGLTDCQDWKCADQPACCTIPVVVFTDDFEHDPCSATACSAACPADPALWQAWGAPMPMVCGGAFVAGKSEACYDVGLLSVASVPLKAGLVVSAGFDGQPEIQGRMISGVTFQDQAAGSVDPCAPIVPVTTALSIEMVSATGGYRFIALFGEAQLAATATISDGARHELTFHVLDDRRVEYQIDGVTFATSSASQTVPDIEQPVHAVVMGRGSTARIDDVRVTLGARCEDPTAWAPVSPFVAFDTSPAGWDSFSVFGPTVLDDSPQQLYFGGCSGSSGVCDSVVAGYGQASMSAAGQFMRDASCPEISSQGLVCPGGLVSPFPDAYDNVFDLDVARGPDGVVGALSGQNTIEAVTANQGVLQLAGVTIEPGDAGSWDAAEVCCAAVVVDPDGTRKIWYTGRAVAGGPRRIGLATWTDAGIVKNPNNPVLSEGDPGGYDDHGVSNPDVLWDAEHQLYRMWYAADGPLGLTSIGYAISTDGVHWHPAPQNPVVTSGALGLRQIGAPSVVLRDGVLNMWLEGVSPDRAGGQIYQVVNGGADPQH